MPIYHEAADRVYAGVRQTWLSVKRAGMDRHCDFYLLSDSADQGTCAQEQSIYEALLPDFDDNRYDMGRLFLVRRENRRNFKAGNIANFLLNHGGSYEFMVVLDADSVMLGEAIQRLILAMEARPDVAILQTVVIPIRAATPFARSMQYGIARCIPLFARGMYWFMGRDSVYWGHNAVIRLAPFMDHCNLPIMPGKPPLGGPILSQDIVEAALLGRAGWGVEWDVDSGGSFDELPANILTYARRDQRWCQGNFQHFWLIFGDGMRLAHRLYFANGIMAYASGPLLLVLMFLGFLQGLLGRVYRYDSLMFLSYCVLFLTMLILPRVLGLVSVLCAQARNWPREVFSSVVEFGISFLTAPALFYLHTRIIIGIFAGRVVAWKNQPRNPSEGLSWANSVRAFWVPTLLGIVWLILTLREVPSFFIYVWPFWVGWIFAIPVTVLTSSPALGRYLIRSGLFPHCLEPYEVEELGALLRESDIQIGSVSAEFSKRSEAQTIY